MRRALVADDAAAMRDTWRHILDPARPEAGEMEALARDQSFELTCRIRHAHGSLDQVRERGRRTSPPEQTRAVLEGFIADLPQT